MVFARNIAALVAASASLVAAVPTASTKAFTINQVASEKKVFKSGPIAYRNALAKYHATIPEHINAAADGSQQGSAEADPQSNDEEYLVPVTVGGQSLTLDFDTGSADLWVFSTETPSDEVNGQATYNPSSGQQLQGETWSISYGDGSGASGDVYADTVVVGGVTATGQAVEAATSVSSSFASNSANDGLLGLAFSSINTVSPDKQTTFFDTVSSSLAAPLFAVTLKHQQPGSYDFGYIDNGKYTGDLVYTPVDNSQGFWSFTADSTSAGGSITGIADTGTTLILLDDNTVSSYYSGVSGASNSQSAGGYVFDCNTTPPDFTVTIAGTTFTVPGSYINFAPNGDGTCFGGIQSSGGIGFSIFGDVFLKAVYVVFDSGNTQLGFAAQA